jgi:hypothetical protein
MPTKLSVAHLMDHGIAAAPAAAFSPVESMTVTPVLLPGEAGDQVLKAAKNVSLRDVQFAAVAKAITTAKTPAQVAAALIKARYDALGGAKGFLGASENTVTVCPDGVGYFQHFKGGSIYYHPHTGAHEVHGLIRARWAAMGWERSFLGYPRTDETRGNDTRHEGRYNHFQGGSLYWHPSIGAREVHGAIRAKYLELGAEASFLGYPTTDETATPDGAGRFNHFQAGSIYWTARTWAHEVHGLIRQFWAQHGWERNPQLGYPISDELIPHRGVGFTRPPSIRKPLVAQPLDVIRLPDPQPSPTIAESTLALRTSATTPVSTAPTVLRMAGTPVATAVSAPAPSLLSAAAAPRLSSSAAAAVAAASASPSAASAAGLRLEAMTPAVVVEAIRVPPVSANPVASHKGQSQDRYGDFENGVLFWKRGATSAVALAPRAKGPNGAKLAWTGAEIAALAGSRIRQALTGIPGGSVIGVNYAGTTGYSYDGAGVHNRAHRVHAILHGQRSAGIMVVPSLSTVEIHVEVSFDPVDREIVAYLTKWNIAASQGDFLGGGSLARALQQRLDPALWREFQIADIPVVDDDPIAVLSVKTQADGDVVVYFEP